MDADVELDLSGLRCPLPVLRTKKALSSMRSGQLLRVYATDPDAAQDIPAFVGRAGHVLERQESVGDEATCFYVRRR